MISTPDIHARARAAVGDAFDAASHAGAHVARYEDVVADVAAEARAQPTLHIASHRWPLRSVEEPAVYECHHHVLSWSHELRHFGPAQRTMFDADVLLGGLLKEGVHTVIWGYLWPDEGGRLPSTRFGELNTQISNPPTTDHRGARFPPLENGQMTQFPLANQKLYPLYTNV